MPDLYIISRATVARLPGRLHAAYRLWLDGADVPEIATRLHTTKRQVRWRLAHASAQLRSNGMIE